jgi:hypothetical protein
LAEVNHENVPTTAFEPVEHHTDVPAGSPATTLLPTIPADAHPPAIDTPDASQADEPDTVPRAPLPEPDLSEIPSRDSLEDVATQPAATTTAVPEAHVPLKIIGDSAKLDPKKEKPTGYSLLILQGLQLVRAVAIAVAVWVVISAEGGWKWVEHRFPPIARRIDSAANKVSSVAKRRLGVDSWAQALEHLQEAGLVTLAVDNFRHVDERIARGRVEKELHRAWSDAVHEFEASGQPQKQQRH